MQIKKLGRRLLPPILVDLVRGRPAGTPTFAREGEFKVELRKISRAGATYFLPAYALHRPACSDMLAGRFSEPATHRLIPALLEELGGNMVHAGTFFGDMLPTFARTGARIYAFEPVLENYVLARLCVIENELTNVVLFHSALGITQGTARMDTGGTSHSGGASHVSEHGQITTLLSIDSVAPENVCVLQLDVEGYELPALRGAVTTIERDNPVILIEDNTDTCAAFLDERGYSRAGSIPGLTIWTRGHAIAALEGLS